MKKKDAAMKSLYLTVALAVALGLTTEFAAAGTAREKVLVDADMVQAFDDGAAMILLANAPNIELVGVTTLAGNSWASEGAAYAIRQLEIEGRNVPVAIGLDRPLRPNRRDAFPAERQLFGLGHDTWVGSFGYDDPGDWRTVYGERYGREPEYAPDSRHAVDFIIDTVRANPGEITIAAIGPCGNLALAVRKAPDIVPLIKRVVYMGGSFYQPGNVTPAAEFNWWFDPEAAKIALRTPFAEQVVVGLDVCEKVRFLRSHHDDIIKMLGTGGQADIYKSTFVGSTFANDPDFTHFIWDVIVAAIIIDPTLITGEKTALVDINTDFGPSYGQSLAYPKDGPVGAQTARIITDIDIDRFWAMLLDTTYWRSVEGF